VNGVSRPANTFSYAPLSRRPKVRIVDQQCLTTRNIPSYRDVTIESDEIVIFRNSFLTVILNSGLPPTCLIYLLFDWRRNDRALKRNHKKLALIIGAVFFSVYT